MDQGAFLYGFLGSAGAMLILTGPVMAVVAAFRPEFVWPFLNPTRVKAVLYSLIFIPVLGIALFIAGMALRGNTHSGDMELMLPVAVGAFFAPWVAVPVWRLMARRIGLPDPGVQKHSPEAALYAYLETLLQDGPLDTDRFAKLDAKRAELGLPESLLGKLKP